MIIKIEPYENGAHANQSTIPQIIPEGWAVIPEDMETPNFPFGEIEVEEVEGIMTVTKWTAGTIPEPPSTPISEPKPTTEDILNVLLGVTE